MLMKGEVGCASGILVVTLPGIIAFGLFKVSDSTFDVISMGGDFLLRPDGESGTVTIFSSKFTNIFIGGSFIDAHTTVSWEDVTLEKIDAGSFFWYIISLTHKAGRFFLLGLMFIFKMCGWRT